MRVFILIAVLAIVITACQSVGLNLAEQTGVVQTQAQELVNVLVLTDAARTQEAVAKSTETPKPAVLLTKTPTSQSAEDFRNELISILSDCLENCEEMEDVETATVIRFTDSGLEIEVRTVWASQDRQPIISYRIVSLLLVSFADWEPEAMRHVFNTNQPSFHVVSYSTDGDYRYESITSLETLKAVANKSISYEEWVIAANAGFR